jgi:predicted DNA-binding transcriptional regulator YafY
MAHDDSPTTRALVTLELIQNSPGVTAQRIGDTLGVSERAARRYVSLLREAGMPIESLRGPYGGYRVGRGLRVPPLMFSTVEALGLVMAVLDGHHDAADPAGPVGSALAKIIRVLPEQVARQAEAVRRITAPAPDRSAARPSHDTTAALVQACAAHRRVQLRYRPGSGADWTTTVDPWAVVVRHGRWYLLCWSHEKNAVRTLRIDRVADVDLLRELFQPPAGLDPVRTLEEHLATGWEHHVEVHIDASVESVDRWLPRSLGRRETLDSATTRLVATTNDPHWYVTQLAQLEVPYRIIGSPEVRAAAYAIGRRLLDAGGC